MTVHRAPAASAKTTTGQNTTSPSSDNQPQQRHQITQITAVAATHIKAPYTDPAARRQPAAARNSAPKTCPRIHHRPNKRTPPEPHAPSELRHEATKPSPRGRFGWGWKKKMLRIFLPCSPQKKEPSNDDSLFCGEQGSRTLDLLLARQAL